MEDLGFCLFLTLTYLRALRQRAFEPAVRFPQLPFDPAAAAANAADM